MKGVRRVHMHEPLTSVLAVFVIQFERNTPQTEVWRALRAAALLSLCGQLDLAVDDDIDRKIATRFSGRCLIVASRNTI